MSLGFPKLAAARAEDKNYTIKGCEGCDVNRLAFEVLGRVSASGLCLEDWFWFLFVVRLVLLVIHRFRVFRVV